MGMYLRTTQRKNGDGSIVRYVQLAHNRRVDGVTQAEVLLNLGREDRMDPEGLRRLVSSINRYLGEPTPPSLRRPRRMRCEVDVVAADGRGMVAGRPVAASSASTARCARCSDGRRFTTDVERVLFALVANRAIDPASKLAAAEWATCDVAVPGLEAMDEDQAYRAMDLLVAADTAGPGAGGGVLRRRRPVQPRGRLVVLRHHLHLLRDRQRRRRRGCAASTGTPRTTARTCRRSSSAWR